MDAVFTACLDQSGGGAFAVAGNAQTLVRQVVRVSAAHRHTATKRRRGNFAHPSSRA